MQIENDTAGNEEKKFDFKKAIQIAKVALVDAVPLSSLFAKAESGRPLFDFSENDGSLPDSQEATNVSEVTVENASALAEFLDDSHTGEQNDQLELEKVAYGKFRKYLTVFFDVFLLAMASSTGYKVFEGSTLLFDKIELNDPFLMNVLICAYLVVKGVSHGLARIEHADTIL